MLIVEVYTVLYLSFIQTDLDNDLIRCSRYITIPCSTLAGFLDIETNVVIDIENRFTDKSVQNYHILKKWVNQNSATKQQAHDRLKAMKQEKAAKRLSFDNMTVLLPAYFVIVI